MQCVLHDFSREEGPSTLQLHAVQLYILCVSHNLRLRFLLPEARGLAFLDPKFAQEHDERISFGHRARVQQPARGQNQQPGWLPAGSPRARTHPTKIRVRIQTDIRIQIVHALSQLDSCTRGWMGARACDYTDPAWILYSCSLQKTSNVFSCAASLAK